MKQALTPHILRIGCVGSICAALAGCDLAPQTTVTPPLEPGVFAATRDGPEGAPEGTCWGRTFSPAVVESVSERVQITPAEINPDGSIAKLPTYRTEDRQVIVTPRKSNWFETPCADVLTVEFVSSLQRALMARSVYQGEISGVMDDGTRDAVRLIQQQNSGLNSEVLSIETARALGLITVERSPLE